MTSVKDLLTSDEIRWVKWVCRMFNAQKVKLSDGIWRHAPERNPDVSNQESSA